MEKYKLPVPGEIYRHFKNKLYQIIAIAIHSETDEKMVVYQALYGKYQVFVRPLENFISKVDEHTYRFTLVDRDHLDNHEEDNQATSVKENRLDTIQKENAILDEPFYYDNSELIQFLDAKTCQEKLNILTSMKNQLNNNILNNMLISLDLAITDGTLEEHFDILKDYLQTRARFEINRLR
ncbi:DUF1653 domain-containing protein [Anaeromicropila herbilytica]|uniref:DUF1653 domain-containing protein n=1 Tax=Anaeromicropila herbilytica TaxID=2785025 RepID=A0A7R7EJI2_9FIRM|nr:DUF1653 domain-containing protein [Anaeromicropila herbilytica]BCN29904.1 hypothetical protein bsdtb5_11990 [Anaeromicropila herbilytica]